MKVFSTTMARDRESLGERISEWLRAHPGLTPVDTEVTQSSDHEFHCLTVTLFLQGDATKLLGAHPATTTPVRATPAPRPLVPTARR